jgi:shikimate 5-dehydrogenase
MRRTVFLIERRSDIRNQETETPLVRLARERGARIVAGDRMLLYQGVLAQRLRTGREPNVKAMDREIS